MKIQSYKRFLLNQAIRIANIDTRSFVKLIKTNNIRVQTHVMALMIENDSYLTNSSDKMVAHVAKEAIKIAMGLESKYKNDIERYKSFYQNYLNKLDSKRTLANKIQDTSMLYSVCKSLNINFGNAYSFFVKKQLSFLTIDKAMNIIIECQ